MKFKLLIASCLLFFAHCTDECEKDNEKLGDVSLADETRLFIDYYADKDIIRFENNNGDVREHNLTVEESGTPRLCVNVICRPSFEIDGANGCEYYDAEDKYYILKAGDLFLHMKAGIEMYQAETELFYDFVEIGLTEEFDSYFAGLVSSSNFTTPTIDTSQTILTEELIFMENDTLGGFQNVWVYKQQDDENDVYLILDQIKGIIQYKYDDTIWTLVE